MKKLFALLAITATFLSCHNDDDAPSQQQAFFNLAEGNLWVYKRYNVNPNGEQLQYMPTDTVKIIGQEVINGLSYYKLQHSNITHHNGFEYQRIDAAGHLVNQYGVVYHPGTDANYTDDINNDPYGTVKYQLQAPVQQTVSGTNYTVYPYVGYFTPSAEYPDVAAGVGDIIGYQPGIGKVVKKSRFISDTNAYVEDRLVYYELN